MSRLPDALWVNVSPSLRGFDRPLLQFLCQKFVILEWQYHQTVDEPISIEVAINLLHTYLKGWERPLHLLGHGSGGLLSFLYACRYPEDVQSITLLSVGPNLAIDWQAHYYALLRLLPCSRECLLTQMVNILMGHQCPSVAKQFKRLLDKDLANSLSPHTLYSQTNITPRQVSVPLLLCSGREDVIVNIDWQEGWRPWLKQSDRLWQCPNGRYFFHYFFPELVGDTIMNFWGSPDSEVNSPSDPEIAHFK